MNFPQGSVVQQGQKSSSRDPSLMGLVEQYLAENSSLSYINIDDMVNCLQGKSFRFARMKKQVFANMVRKSYCDYCQRNEGVATEGPADTIHADSDSDVEIQEEYQPRNDLVNSHLTSLYSATKKVQPNATNARQDGNNLGNTGNITSVVKKTNRDSSATSSVLETISKEHKLRNAETGVSENVASRNADDSDNDLEIIEEVIGDGVIRQNNGNLIVSNSEGVDSISTNGFAGIPSVKEYNVSSRDTVSSTSQQQVELLSRGFLKASKEDTKHLNSILTGNNVTITTVASNDTRKGRSPTHSNAKPREVEVESQAPQRGTKRKTPASFHQGLNEDMTPKKLKKEISVVQDSGYRLSDFAGSEKVVEEVCRLLMHLKHPEVYKTLGVTAPRGFLLHGPPGTGKTLLANALAGELQLPMLKVTGTEFISGISGESESNIRDLFNQAVAIAPCIIFIDEIDSITPKRENAQREMERRVVAQLLSCVDDLMNHERGSQVLLIGATNRIEAIDSALRRAGRFDREICLGIPDEKSRAKILSVICRNLRLAPGFDLSLLAKYTPGYVGADLSALVREAAVQAVNKALLGSDKMRMENETSNDQSDFSVIPCENSIKVTENEVSALEITTTALDSVATSKPEVLTAVGPTADSSSERGQPEITHIVSSTDQPNTADKQIETGEKVPKPATKNLPNTEEENMETDSSEILSTTVVIDKVEQQNTKVAGEQAEVQSHIIISDQPISQETLKEQPDEENDEEPSHLRWIRETAPLSKNELDELYIFMDDFEIALKYVQPSSKREGFATVPDTTWDDIGALKDIREELEVSILGPVKHSSAFQMLGLNTPAGVLLCGPPGCGKTLLAKAVANEAGINFISVKGPELLNMYVGESERAVRQCFLRAKNSSPCVIFFDELDALCPRRSDNPESGSGSRIVNQLLTEMDGMESRAGVFVMAATNRPDIIDPAILRPGRLDKILFVDLPTAADRFDILKAITKKGTRPILDEDVNMKEISEREACDNYTGADLAALVREASIAAFRDLILNPTSACQEKDLKVSARHFETAFFKTKPSVTKKDRQKYAEMKERYSSLRER